MGRPGGPAAPRGPGGFDDEARPGPTAPPGTRAGAPTAALPEGAALRRWVRDRIRSRDGARGRLKTLERLYTALLYVLVLGSILVPQLRGLSSHGARTAGGAVVHLDPAWAMAALVGAVGALALGPLRRLGPVCLRPHEVAWLLPMPGQRRGLLAPVARALAGLVLAAGALAGLGVGLASGAGPLIVGAWSALMGVAGLTGILSLIAAQVRGRWATTLSGLPALVAAALIAVGALALPLRRSPWLGPMLLAAAAAGALGAAAAWRAVSARLGRIEDRELIEVSSRAHSAQASALSLDTRALGRLLGAPPRMPAGPSAMGLAVAGGSLPRPARVMLVVAQADALLLARSPRRWIQLGLGLVLAGLPWTTGATHPVVAGAAHLVGSWLAVLAVAEPARRAWFDPGAQDHLPAGPLVLRWGHLVAPAAVMTLWSLAAAAPVASASPRPALVLATALLAAAGWAGAALRTGFRRIPDFSAPPISTPGGMIPPWIGEVIIAGYEAALLVSLPTALLAAGAGPGPLLLAIQAVVSGVVVAWGIKEGDDRQ
ncbi:DUF6297 family protein [Actinomyces bowdenii]|nr:DUF6297 family protein [Actinomyces bowdenii]